MSAVVPQPVSLVRAIGHLCAVDLRRFRWLVAGVAGLELLRVILVEWSLQLAPPTMMVNGPPPGAELPVWLLDFGIVLTTAIGTGILVQADHPTDDRAFWRTRPIPPLAVALAKVATMALLFVGIPAALNAMRLAAYGAPAVAVVAATLQIAVLAGVVCVPAWFVAVLTRTLPLFLGTLFGTILAGYLALGTVMMLLGGWRTPMRPGLGVVPMVFDWQHTEMHGWWGGVFSTLLGLAIAATHYVIRRIEVTIAGLLLLVLIPSLIPARSTERPAPADLAGRVARQLTLPQGLQALSSSGGGYEPPTIHVTGLIRMPTLPPDLSAGIRLERISLRAGGERVLAEGREQCCAGKGAIGAISADAVPVNGNRLLIGNNSLEVFNVKSLDAPALRRGPIDLDADAAVYFSRHRVAGALPLRPGGSLRTSDFLVEVIGLETLTGPPAPYGDIPRMDVLLRFTRFPSMSGASLKLDLFIADRGRQVIEFVRAPWPIATYNPDTTVDNFAMGRRWAARVSMRVYGGRPLPAEPDLVVVESTPVGTLHTHMTAANVPILLPPPGAMIH
jgi:hypothetical protein